MWIPKEKRTKLDRNSRRCIFLGYAKGVKGYRLWDPTTHKIVVSRDVVFNEESFQGTKKKQDDEAITSIEFFNAGDEVQAEQAQVNDEIVDDGLVEEDEPTSYRETCESTNAEKWHCAIEEEIESL
ncbi:uncharacterized protein [Elaeis guineensis]|uniref:uncharacterized protein n=1 Tax=Elaeis guineensis var. tenera TaxID=51953 RepID=UPI003C6D0208